MTGAEQTTFFIYPSISSLKKSTGDNNDSDALKQL